MKKILLFLFVQCAVVTSALSQDIIIIDGLLSDFASCDAIVTDQGFLVGDYQNNSDILVTICSDNGDGLQIEFAEFDLEDGFDFLTVYDGPDELSPQVTGSPFTGATINTLISTGTCLTFEFNSNESITGSGWAGALSCVPIGPPVDCLVDYDLVIDPPYNPDGTCGGGETFNYCFTINDWNGDSPNEFHGFDLTFASGIDASTLVPVSVPASCDGLGTWGFYPSVTSVGTGLVTGPGFFYDADGDGDPGNNAGDACAGALPWTFCFDVTMDPCDPLGLNNLEDASITINTYSDGESGLFNDPSCGDDDLVTIDGALFCPPPCPGDCDLCPPIAAFADAGPITTCPSDLTVDIEIMVTNYIPPYTITYTHLGGSTTVTGSGDLVTITVGAVPGSSTLELVSITDAACSDVLLDGTVELIGIEAPFISFLDDGEICIDGTLDLELEFSSLDVPPSPPYDVTYTIDGAPGGSFTSATDNYILTISEPGTYELTQIGFNDCIQDLVGPSVVITPADTVFAEISGDTIVCEGQAVDLDLVLTGEPPFNVAISLNGFPFDFVTYPADGLQSYTAFASGVYTISSVTDANCAGIPLGTATVDYFEVPTVTISGGGYACTGEDVEILFESTGTAPWTVNYSIDAIPQAPISLGGSPFTLLTQTSGLYTLSSATDDNDCPATVDGEASVIVSMPPTGDISGDITLCEGEMGNLNLILTGNDPYIIEYEIDGILQEADTIAAATGFLQVDQAGTYTLVSISDSICDGSVSGIGNVTITPAPMAIISGPDSVCSGADTELLVELTGSPDFSVDIFYNGTFYENFNTDNDSIQFLVTDPGQYSIAQVTDMNCFATDLDSLELAFYPTPDIELSSDTILCFGDSITIGGSATGGFGGPYIYQWVIGSDTLDTDSITIVADLNTNYEFLVYDGCGIPYSQNLVIGVHPYPIFDDSGFDLGICGQGTLVLDTEIPLSLFGDSCVWNINGQIFNTCDSIEIELTTAEAYDLDLYVFTEQGCVLDSVFNDLIQVNEVPIAAFSYTPNDPNISEDLLSFQDLSTGATTYSWLLDSLEFSNEPAPTLDLPDRDIPHAYTICMAVSNDFGCVDTVCQLIKIEGDLIVYVPSAFTPDNDLVNDSWAPSIIGAIEEEYLLRVYGRNGQVIWESTDMNERWIGQGADDQNYYSGDSIYQWQLELRRLGSVDKRTYQGIVTLVR